MTNTPTPTQLPCDKLGQGCDVNEDGEVTDVDHSLLVCFWTYRATFGPFAICPDASDPNNVITYTDIPAYFNQCGLFEQISGQQREYCRINCFDPSLHTMPRINMNNDTTAGPPGDPREHGKFSEKDIEDWISQCATPTPTPDPGDDCDVCD